MEQEPRQDNQSVPEEVENAKNVESKDALRDSRRRLLKAGVLASIPVLITVTARPAFASAYVTGAGGDFEMINHHDMYYAQSEQKDRQKHG